MSETVDSSARRVPVLGSFDVVVCGGGPAGFAAAVAARRHGASVLLVEGQGQLGGMGTSGLVSHWLGGRGGPSLTWVVGGIFREMSEEAAAQGIALIPQDTQPPLKYTPHGWLKGLHHGIPFDPFAMAAYHDRKAAAEDVPVLLHTRAIDILRDGPRVSHVLVHNKSGIQAVRAGCCVDATGDADIAALAGCPCDKGDENGNMTVVTLECHVDNVDQQVLADYVHAHDSPRFRELIADLRERGEWPQNVDIFICVQLTEPGTMMLNTTRVCDIDGTDGWSVTRGMQRGREEIEALLPCLRKHFPGFANVRLKAVAPALGVRETRRIHGEYRLTVEDVAAGRSFDDTIGLSSYGWDLADPKRPSYQPFHGRPKPPVTPIPYRIMVPRGIANVICPGRAVSVERQVLGPLRVMAPCMAMGEAAGVAAAQAVQAHVPFAALDSRALRDRLRQQGAIIP